MKHTVAIVFFLETGAIWGVFSTHKKAQKAIAAWRKDWIEDFTIKVWTVDYRSPRDAVKYASDTTHTVGHLLTTAAAISDGNIPATSSSRASSI